MTDRIPPEAFLSAYTEPTRAIAERLRRIVGAALPEAVEGVRLGWRIIGYDIPVGRRLRYFCFVMPEPKHVHLGFRWGILMHDPEALLLGDAKLARWVTFRAGDPIDDASLRRLVVEGARVARMSAGKQAVARLDRELHAQDR